MNKIILAALKAGKDVKIGAFRIARYTDTDANDIGIHVREDGTGFTFFDKLTLAGIRRASNWINRIQAEPREAA